VAVCCGALQCVAARCSVLQHVAATGDCGRFGEFFRATLAYGHVVLATHRGAPQYHRVEVSRGCAVCCSVLQCVAVRCGALQCVQWSAACCRVLQRVAACWCSVLQWNAAIPSRRSFSRLRYITHSFVVECLIHVCVCNMNNSEV